MQDTVYAVCVNFKSFLRDHFYKPDILSYYFFCRCQWQCAHHLDLGFVCHWLANIQANFFVFQLLIFFQIE